MAKEKHPIRNTVIAGIILAAILWFASLIPSIWQWLKEVISNIFEFLITSTSIPTWLFLLIILMTLYTILAFIKWLFSLNKYSIRNYKEDNYFNMKWKWEYPLFSNIPDDLWCYCPNDDTILVYKNDFKHNTVSLTCETCGRIFGPIKGDKDHMINMIKRQIDRKIRTEEWKIAIQDSK